MSVVHYSIYYKTFTTINVTETSFSSGSGPLDCQVILYFWSGRLLISAKQSLKNIDILNEVMILLHS